MEYDVGTDNLPEYIRIILSQTPGVNEAAKLHDIRYALGGYFDENGVFVKASRKTIDIMFKEDIITFTERDDLANAYYIAIRYTGSYGWNRAKFRRWWNPKRDWLSAKIKSFRRK